MKHELTICEQQKRTIKYPIGNKLNWVLEIARYFAKTDQKVTF